MRNDLAPGWYWVRYEHDPEPVPRYHRDKVWAGTPTAVADKIWPSEVLAPVPGPDAAMAFAKRLVDAEEALADAAERLADGPGFPLDRCNDALNRIDHYFSEHHGGDNDDE